jgi:hypothetical protein
MKNYTYMIFLTILSHLKPPQFIQKRQLPARSPILKDHLHELPLHLL